MFTFPLDVCKKWWEHSAGNRSAESNENHTCTATDELRTYKINLLGKNKNVLPGNRRALPDRTGNAKLCSRNVLPGNHERAPGQPIQGNAKLCSRATSFVLPGNLNCAPGQPESCSREYNGRKSFHTGARTRAATTGNRSPKSYQNHIAPRRMS